MSVSGFVWKQENFYIRQNKTWNMDKYKVVIVDDDEVSLENLSFELRKSKFCWMPYIAMFGLCSWV